MADTLTGHAMGQVLPIKEMPRIATGSLPVRDACLHNLKHVNVDIPLGIMTVVTGVAGSGKSTLISQVFAKKYERDIVMVDQGPITATNRSTPASYLGFFDKIRELLARESGKLDSLFSFNSAGACPVCGDNYYGCWPNLYAIRGGQYRDIAAWVKSLDMIRSYQAEYLLPGHTKPVCGQKQVEEVLTNFRDAIAYVLEETLRGMNEGKDIDTLAAEIALPEKYANLPYLGEYYGTVEWTVRAIFTGYAGWFDGNPTHLHPLSPKEHGEKSIALMGGAEAVLNAVKTAVEEKEYQWALELCDLLLNAGEQVEDARKWKATALRKIAPMETSANGRHYYLVSACELEKK